MKLDIKLICFIILFCFCLINESIAYPYYEKCASTLDSETILETLNGKVKGECYSVPVSYSNSSKIATDVFTWHSIPYAKPPVNENRYKRPTPIENWSATIDGTKYSKFCTQVRQDIYDGVQWEDVKDEDMSEDCLYLNIFSPADAYKNRGTKLTPILVYIHGGTFVTGGTASDMIEPSTLAALTGLIIVNFNYRLDTIGLLHLAGTEAVGNQAILDQQLALKWIHENAEKFGGDKDKITISGNSAGGISVGYHLLIQDSWPYFRNAILSSGGPDLKGC